MSNFNQKEDALWRKRGYIAAPAEFAVGQRAKRDTFGFLDRWYIGPGGQIVGVQITSRDNMAARITKIREGRTGHGKHRVRMAEIARRLLLNDAVRLLVVGWQLNESTYRLERTEIPITEAMINEALSVSA